MRLSTPRRRWLPSASCSTAPCSGGVHMASPQPMSREIGIGIDSWLPARDQNACPSARVVGTTPLSDTLRVGWQPETHTASVPSANTHLAYAPIVLHGVHGLAGDGAPRDHTSCSGLRGGGVISRKR